MTNARIFNAISLIFIVLTILALLFVGLRMTQPPAADPADAVILPTVVVPATLPPTNTPTRTLPPTFTATGTNTLTPTDTPTETPTPSVSPTITETPGPTGTPTETPTPSVSPTLTPTPTATGPSATPPPTQNPYLYDLRQGQVIFTQNFANTLGCAWQGIGGQVFDISGQPVNGLRIHVFSPTFERFADSGTNSLYGPGGWEVAVDNKISSASYFVELLSAGGTPISGRIQVAFPSDCARNVALVNFIQIR